MPHAVGAALEASLIEQRFGLLRIVGIRRHIVGVEFHLLVRDRRAARLGEAEPDVLHQKILVDRVDDGAPHAHVLQLRLAQIEFEIVDGRVVFVAGGRDGEVGQRLQARHVVQRHDILRAVLHIARLERHRAGGAIRNEAEDQRVEIGPRLVPIVRIALEHDVAAALPFLELERPGADRLLVGRIAQEVGAGIDVLRQDRRFRGGEGAHHVGRGRVEVEDRGQIVGRVDGELRCAKVAVPRE